MANEPIKLDGSKVLIVDDMPANLDVLSQILEQEGYVVSFATSGEEAIRLATLDQPELILLDVMMPEMDGFETCRRLKSLEPTRAIPVIFVTGRTDPQDVHQGFAIGAVDYISKPVRREEVCARTRAHLQAQVLLRLRDELIEKLRLHNERNHQVLVAQREQLVSSSRLASLAELVGEFAHELGTPVGLSLTVVSNLMQENQLLRQAVESGQLSRQTLDEYLAHHQESGALAVSNLERAAAMIQSYRRVVVDQCHEESSRFNLKNYIDQVLMTLAPKLKNTNYGLRVSCPDNLVIDSYAGAFAGIVTNLVNNSLIHGFCGRDKGNMQFLVQAEGDELLFEYRDDGNGIRSEYLDKVFNKYFTSNREGGGSGLGLYLVYCLVCDTLNGSIECQSAEGEGVCFQIRLPLSGLQSTDN